MFTFGPLCSWDELLLGSTGSVKALEVGWGSEVRLLFAMFLCEAIGLSRRALEGEIGNF